MELWQEWSTDVYCTSNDPLPIQVRQFFNVLNKIRSELIKGDLFGLSFFFVPGHGRWHMVLYKLR